MADESKDPREGTQGKDLDEGSADQVGISTRLGWRDVFREAFDKARREQQPTNRRELGRDRSRSLVLVAGAAITIVVLFLGVFSSSNRKKTAVAPPTGTPDLGRKITLGQQGSIQPGSITPLLNAETGQSDVAAEQGVTPEEIGRTARPAPVTSPSIVGPYALGRIDFSDTPRREPEVLLPTANAKPASDDLGKPSLVFVRTAQSTTPNSNAGPAATEEGPTLNLPAGTRLIARLQALVSSAVKTPVVAAIEYNYERDGEIVVPAGAQVIGILQQADRSGYVGIRFDTIQMPDGSTEKIDAMAMSLNFGPLKGVVSGKRTGANFLIRAFTGIGQAASYVVGSNGINAPLSQGALLRDQVATNVGTAGDQQLNSLAFNRDIVVSVPGNTRFYVVIEKRTTEEEGRAARTRQADNASLPTAQEFGQLMQLRQELSALYQQQGGQNIVEQEPQQ